MTSGLQVIVSPLRPCDIAKFNLHISREEAMRRYDQIAEIIGNTGPMHLRLEKRFQLTDLTIDKIKRLFRILDMYFYNRTFFPALAKEKVRIFWELFPFDDNDFQPCLKMMAISRKRGQGVSEVHFQVNQNRFHDSANYRITNGVKARYKLEALMISCLHEMTHGLVYVYCPQQQGHNETFLAINSKIHGSDPTIFEYRDDIPLQGQPIMTTPVTA